MDTSSRHKPGIEFAAKSLIAVAGLACIWLGANGEDAPLQFFGFFAVGGALMAFASSNKDFKRDQERKIERERFETLFEQTSDPHILYDASGIVEMNRAALELLQALDKKDLRTLRPALLAPEFQPDGKNSIQTFQRHEEKLETQGSASFEWTIRKLNGETAPVRVTLSAIEIDRKPSILGVWHDLTNEREAEQQLRQSQQRLSHLVAHTPLAIVERDSQFRVTLWNPAAERMFGWTSDEAQGRLLNDLMLPMTSDDVAIGGAYDQKIPCTHRNGLQIECAWYSTPLVGVDGTVSGWASLILDVTERVRYEDELARAASILEAQNEELVRARDEAIHAAKTKSEFLANMSHEIRTPMNGVIGMTGLLLDTQLTSQQREFAHTIRSSGEALLTVINDVLDFSKIESGKLLIEHEIFNLRVLMEEVADMLSAKADEKSLEFVSSYQPGIPETFYGDGGRLRQVLLNLAGNAIKFTEQGEVVVSVNILERRGASARIRISVRDTGIGISADRLNVIFESFTQADGSTSRKYGGTGLGLTISRQLVELMGGKLNVQSEEGKGSEFAFDLLLNIGEERLPGVASDLIVGLKVLVVDDNQTNRRILIEQLKSWGCEPTEACGGAEALDLLERESFGLCILDMQMPVMDGVEVARRIRAYPELKHLPLILFSSMGTFASGTANREQLFQAVLAKPVRQSPLFNAIMQTVCPESQARTSARPTQEVLSLEGKRVLLVEDNSVNQKVATRLLERLGARVDSVGNGLEAVNALENLAYDLVLMDCQMPEMDGYEATEKIRDKEKLTSGKRQLVIAMTAHAMEGDREKCLAAGMDDYLSKPIRQEELRQVFSRWLSVRDAA